MAASQVSEKQDQFTTAFRDRQVGQTSDPSWLNRLRENALDRFEQLGIPTVHDEEWKYTSPASIAKIAFSFDRTIAAEPVDLEAHFYPEAAGSRLVFVNGRLAADLSSWSAVPDGVTVISLAGAWSDPALAGAVREHLARSAHYQEKAFDALNTAFLDDGAVILVPRDVAVTSPIQLVFFTSPGKDPLAVFPRVLIVAEQGSTATVVESHAGTDGVYFSNAVTEVVVADGARLNHYKVQNEGAAAFHLASTSVRLNQHSVYDGTTITLGAKLSRHDISVNLDAEGAECWVDGLYIVGDGQHADTHSAIHHAKPHGASHQLYKGIMDGKSHAVFNGKVFVHVDAQGTDARQTNRNLLLSNDARVDTKPQLEIFADDVKCAHGATVGQLEEEELFYLISRGLHPELARNLLTYGFAEEVIAKITIDSIKAQLDEAVLHRLRARLEA
jgi:Fe-S cluster assembly protein SufD